MERLRSFHTGATDDALLPRYFWQWKAHLLDFHKYVHHNCVRIKPILHNFLNFTSDKSISRIEALESRLVSFEKEITSNGGYMPWAAGLDSSYSNIYVLAVGLRELFHTRGGN